jgi:RND family efflux transporter MFP subunit
VKTSVACPAALRRAALGVLALVLVCGLAACGGAARTGEVWYCPMHPTYVSDHPGTCPICNMDLVKKEPPATPAAAAPAAPAPAPAARKVLFYRNPMDPTVTSPVPARDSMGMDYVPVYADEVAPDAGAPPGHAAVELSEEVSRLAGVRTEEVRRESLARTIRTVGRVVPDESRLYRPQTRIGGWVEKLYVGFEGQQVVQGQPMLAIYSPELLASQQDYLSARANARLFLSSSVPEVRSGGEQLVAAARRRLELLDMPEAQLAEIERTGKPLRTIDLMVPASGFVIAKSVVAGARVEPGTELYTIADLSRLWVEADFYESEARFVAVGQEATLTLPYDPNLRLTARVSYVYPQLDAEARTLRARFDLPNPGLRLRPGMFVDVEQELPLGDGLVVPDSAVIDSGLRQIVFVETAPGRFEPRAVEVRWRGDGKARLADGPVTAGERVVVKANFLLDSESRLRAAVAAVAGKPAPGSRP